MFNVLSINTQVWMETIMKETSKNDRSKRDYRCHSDHPSEKLIKTINHSKLHGTFASAQVLFN